MKILKYTLLIIFSLFLIVGIFFQLKVESYKKNQNIKYDILKGRERLSYMPAVIYYLKKGDKYKRSSLLPYIKKGLNKFSSSSFYDEYIVYCYFTKLEINEYLASPSPAGRR